MDAKEYTKVLREYTYNQGWLNDVDVTIKGGENTIDPLELLRRYEAPVTADNNALLAQLLCRGKTVVISRKGKPVLEFTYREGNITEHFNNAPYLLNTFLDVCYGLMVKKLTPPSPDSESEERPSNEQDSAN